MDKPVGDCPLFDTAVELVELMDPWTKKQVSHVFLLLLACSEDGPLDMGKVEILRHKLSEESGISEGSGLSEERASPEETGQLAGPPGVDRISA